LITKIHVVFFKPPLDENQLQELLHLVFRSLQVIYVRLESPKKLRKKNLDHEINEKG